MVLVGIFRGTGSAVSWAAQTIRGGAVPPPPVTQLATGLLIGRESHHFYTPTVIDVPASGDYVGIS